MVDLTKSSRSGRVKEAPFILTLRYASEHTIDLAVRGGGHSTAGASSTSGGVVIDLSSMRSVTVDPTAKTLTIQGGAQWSDVDDAAWEHGLATVGGTVADTGVGGLTLGGGYGWLSGTHGLVVDNLLSCEIVLANGEVVRASKDENTDLFWALRGAGQNFGVVTEFVLQAWKQNNVWAGLIGFPTEKLGDILDVLNEIILEMNGRGTCVLGFGRPPPAGGQVLVIVPVFYDGTEEEGQAGFKRLLDVGPIINTASSVPYNTVNRMLHVPQGRRVSMKGASFTLPLRLDFVKSTMDAYTQFTSEVPDSQESLLLYEIMDPSKICEVGNQEMSFANRGRRMNAMVGPMWTSQEHDERSRVWAREVAELFKVELSRDKGRDGKGEGVGVYGNYDREFPFSPSTYPSFTTPFFSQPISVHHSLLKKNQRASMTWTTRACQLELFSSPLVALPTPVSCSGKWKGGILVRCRTRANQRVDANVCAWSRIRGEIEGYLWRELCQAAGIEGSL